MGWGKGRGKEGEGGGLVGVMCLRVCVCVFVCVSVWECWGGEEGLMSSKRESSPHHTHTHTTRSPLPAWQPEPTCEASWVRVHSYAA